MDWNRIPDDAKKTIIAFTGGFRVWHVSTFNPSLRSIERRHSDLVCYICGLQNSFLRCGLTRNPSTRMYVKKNQMTVEVFGKCLVHVGDSLSVGGVLLPRSVETEEDIHEFVKNMYPGTNKVFMFTADEDSHPGWKILECTLVKPRSNSVVNA